MYLFHEITQWDVDEHLKCLIFFLKTNGNFLRIFLNFIQSSVHCKKEGTMSVQHIASRLLSCVIVTWLIIICFYVVLKFHKIFPWEKCIIKFKNKMDATPSFGVTMISEVPSNPQLNLADVRTKFFNPGHWFYFSPLKSAPVKMGCSPTHVKTATPAGFMRTLKFSIGGHS